MKTKKPSRLRKIAFCSFFFALGFTLFMEFGPKKLSSRSSVAAADFPVSSSKTSRAPAISSVDKVKAQVDAANRQNEKHRQNFSDHGWTFVESDKPDAQITGLDPEALKTKEQAVQVHLQTNTFGGEMLDRVKVIAVTASTAKTRHVAVESLGRSYETKAQKLLTEVFDSISADEETQGLIVQNLRPQSLNDSTAEFLFSRISDERLPFPVRKQMVSTLAVVTANERSRSAEISDVLTRIPDGLQSEFIRVFKALGATL